MSTSVSNIKTQLSTILAAVSALSTGQILTYLPRYLDKGLTVGMWYDSARFEPAEINSQWAYYNIQIVIYIPCYDEKTMQDDQDSIGDAVMDAIRAKPSLNSTCQGFEIDGLKNDLVDTGNGNVYGVIVIDMIVKKEEDN